MMLTNKGVFFLINTTKIVAKKADATMNKIAIELKKKGKIEEYDLLVLFVKYMIDLYRFEVNNYQSNQFVPQIISRTIMEAHFYVLFLTKSEGNKKEYQIKKTAYKLIAQRDELKKLINLYSDQLIDTNNPKDLVQREKIREATNNFKLSKTKIEEKKEVVNDKIKEFLEKNYIGIKPKDFKHFYNVSKDRNGNYLQNLQNLALYVGEGERYNLLMYQTSKRVHATNVYEEYDLSTMIHQSNPDDNIPIFIGAIFIGNALKNITNFCNIKSVFDKDLGRYVDSLKHRIQIELYR
ncbi:hypothetical protein SH83_03735 [Lactiplantibacillus plantarum]|uniref:hypothetical protein n=1 Tax=Lactiplantibacillus plantarum TaxID=1590 RepID=UPI0005BEDDDA|nr:hypothetical protein [Lactiplantibacillus plantarum]AJO73502.1 hypothetical protein SH83_03735 [Lactiplantibacillus plantarum]MCW0154583.1 hypothetical protein [Lactiplantibacillus plantarum]